MKKTISFILAFILLLSGCAPAINEPNTPSASTPIEEDALEEILNSEFAKDDNSLAERYSELSDPHLLQHVEDSIYTNLVSEYESEDFIIENVKATYVSKEYIEELEYNSKSNIFFGYTLAELEEQFHDEKYVFTLGDDGNTIVQPFENYDDTFDQIIKNVAIGTGVILVCVTVSVVTGAAGLETASMVFAVSAKESAKVALSVGTLSTVVSGFIEGMKTHDFEKALKVALLHGSKDFKWGAIAGSLEGGITKLSAIRRTSKATEGGVEYAPGTVEIPDDVPTWRQSELRELNRTGGYEQLSYLKGKQVPFGTPGATRPDIIRNLKDHIEAVEVKNYDLESSSSLSALFNELKREITARINNLPAGSTQRIVLDVTGRDYSETLCVHIKEAIQRFLSRIYPNIPVEIVGIA